MTVNSHSMVPTAAATRERRRFYDSTAGLYSAWFPLIWRFGFRELHDWLGNQMQGRQDLLDAGCGPGYWSRHLARVESRNRVVALDFSKAYLDHARRLLPRDTNVQLIQADLMNAPFRTGSFDAILCCGVLDTFPDPEPAFREFRRLLRNGGRLVLLLRGKGGLLSPAIDWFFRACIGLTRVLRTRSLQSAGVSTRLWNRNPIWARLDDLTEVGAFDILYLHAGRHMTRVVMTPNDRLHPR